MSTTTHSFKVNDRVTFPPDALVKPSLLGQVFVIDQVPEGRRSTYYISMENNRARRFRVRPGEIIPAPEGDQSIGRPYMSIEWFEPGEIVTVSNGQRKNIGPADPYVVTKDSGANTVGIAPLGGSGSSWRWPRAALVKRDLAWLTERLVEMA